ncbi:MAG: RNA 3'-terminal phosphate cyclase [Psychrobacter sp.]|uniref:RNA 3'-terminal phosphate cyclase n=1 Tax=Psychrobacter sp. AOP7-B1-24 TaxID=3457645 RepID=UPI003FB68C12
MSFTPNHSAQATSSAVVNTNTATLKIDGRTGEGGGQIIRTALSLSMLTGIPIEITNIRAGRAKSGLMRQHLMCVQASQQISNATVTGAALGSSSFRFAPNAIQSGDYHFDIGSAGSTNLVLQTLLPALLFANTNIQAASTVTIKGGTHNPLAPTTDFLQHAFVPALAKLGMQVDIEYSQAGFAPIGGGVIKATITPFMRRAGSQPLTLTERGTLTNIALVASVLNLEYDIGKRELASATATLMDSGVDDTLMTSNTNHLDGIGEGNTCSALVTHQYGNQIHQEMFTLLGEKRTSAEKMGNRLAGLVKRYLFKTNALVDEYLSDQLLLPLALSGGGEFTARIISQHTETQAWLIEQFLPVEISFEAIDEQKNLVRVII